MKDWYISSIENNTHFWAFWPQPIPSSLLVRCNLQQPSKHCRMLPFQYYGSFSVMNAGFHSAQSLRRTRNSLGIELAWIYVKMKQNGITRKSFNYNILIGKNFDYAPNLNHYKVVSRFFILFNRNNEKTCCNRICHHLIYSN